MLFNHTAVMSVHASKVFSFSPGDILGWIILWCRKLSCALLGSATPLASTHRRCWLHSSPRLESLRMSPDIDKCPMGAKSLLVENDCTEGMGFWWKKEGRYFATQEGRGQAWGSLGVGVNTLLLLMIHLYLSPSKPSALFQGGSQVTKRHRYALKTKPVCVEWHLAPAWALCLFWCPVVSSLPSCWKTRNVVPLGFIMGSTLPRPLTLTKIFPAFHDDKATSNECHKYGSRMDTTSCPFPRVRP